jgi:transitional endoplasmic reticulum ATPase
VRRAGMTALRQDLSIERVNMASFEEALKGGRASVTPEMEREYEELSESLKRESPRGGRTIGFHAAVPPAV